MRRPSGLRGFAHRHPLAADTLLVVVLGLITGPASIHSQRPQWLAALIQTLLWLPLIWRRRAPEGVFAFLALVALAQWLLDIRLAGDFALLIALYTVAAHRPRPRARLAGGILQLGIVLAAVRWSQDLGSTIASIVFLTGTALAAFLIGINLQTRRAYLAALIDRAERLERERDQQAQLAAAAERARIAREMHDIVAHSLSVVVTLAEAATLTLRTRPDDAETAMRQVSATGRAALAETRRLLGVLRDEGGAAATQPQPDVRRIDDLLDTVRSTGLPATLRVEGSPFELPATAQTALYRIVQEALTNTLKHAIDPTRVDVALTYAAPAVRVSIRDDGRSAGATAARHRIPSTGAGHGLAGMRERAAIYAGTVEAGPHPVSGWRVVATLRIDDEQGAR